ncbi:MAG: NGG1p interacting factor NIF3 [Patescibacteria group bacterium]|jgi:putative NIF3 family GTP cyclohydrolase 1 type 2|nr:NGG1p interacting factor NIF3 [Patescibacteria group bacterium]
MTTKEIYNLAVKLGIENDLRGEAYVNKTLARTKKKYEKMDKEKKEFFDVEKLNNPYSDTRVLADHKKKKIKKLLVGIDMETPELLLADKLGDIDLVIAHHPEGVALSDLSDVMYLQVDILAGYGVPINVAEALMKQRVNEVSRGISPVNHNRAVDSAKLLKMDYMCTHTIADNLGANFLVKLFEKKKPEYVDEILKLLNEIPEYKESNKHYAGPRLFTGAPENRCGKIAVTEFTGGTSGSKEMYEKMSQAGVGTIISMHMGEDYRKEAEKYHMNVVIAGHMASDSLGMNLFLDEVEKKGVEVVTTSGLIRVKRGK